MECDLDQFVTLEDMQNQVSINPSGQKTCRTCVLSAVQETIQAYYESRSLEGVWIAVMNKMDEWTLVLYHKLGNGDRKW